MIATRVEQYRTLHGHLPGALAELGHSVPGVTYQRLEDGRYQLVYRSAEGIEVAYDSAQNMSSFLGNTLSELGMLGDGR